MQFAEAENNTIQNEFNTITGFISEILLNQLIMTLYISQTSQYLGKEKKWPSYLSGTAGGVFCPSVVGGGGLAGGLDCCNSIPSCTAA